MKGAGLDTKGRPGKLHKEGGRIRALQERQQELGACAHLFALPKKSGLHPEESLHDLHSPWEPVSDSSAALEMLPDTLQGIASRCQHPPRNPAHIGCRREVC